MIETEEYVIRMEHALMVFESKEVSPVVFSVPHDVFPFHALAGFFTPRKNGFVGRDLHVWPIARDILTFVEISAVRGLAPRALIDYNRVHTGDGSASAAVGDARLQKLYEQYHTVVGCMLERSIARFGKEKTVLFDLHGFTKQPPYAPEGGYDMIMGTANRASILHGNIDEDFARHMGGLGYRIFLPKEKKSEAKEYYDGGFITRHYSGKYGINVVQIEIAPWFRFEEGAAERGKKLSKDLISFFKEHIMKTS